VAGSRGPGQAVVYAGCPANYLAAKQTYFCTLLHGVGLRYCLEPVCLSSIKLRNSGSWCNTNSSFSCLSRNNSCSRDSTLAYVSCALGVVTFCIFVYFRCQPVGLLHCTSRTSPLLAAAFQVPPPLSIAMLAACRSIGGPRAPVHSHQHVVTAPCYLMACCCVFVECNARQPLAPRVPTLSCLYG
jgi:hypothetical protein